MRKNQGKPKLSHLLHMPHAMTGLVRVMEDGDEKYSPAAERGWMKYDQAEAVDSLMRHLTAWMDGAECDVESGLPHVHHIIFNACMIAELEQEIISSAYARPETSRAPDSVNGKKPPNWNGN